MVLIYRYSSLRFLYTIAKILPMVYTQAPLEKNNLIRQIAYVVALPLGSHRHPTVNNI